MRRGPKPTPTKLKLARGSRRIAGRIEPQPDPRAPTCPSNLSDVARKEWRRVAPELTRLGLLTHLDRAALAGYCQSWADFSEARRAIKASGLVVKSEGKDPIVNPYLKVSNTAAGLMQNFLSEFGMSPSSRTRVTAMAPIATDDRKQRFFNPKEAG